jgi:hypothetical protein
MPIRPADSPRIATPSRAPALPDGAPDAERADRAHGAASVRAPTGLRADDAIDEIMARDPLRSSDPSARPPLSNASAAPPLTSGRVSKGLAPRDAPASRPDGAGTSGASANGADGAEDTPTMTNADVPTPAAAPVDPHPGEMAPPPAAQVDAFFACAPAVAAGRMRPEVAANKAGIKDIRLQNALDELAKSGTNDAARNRGLAAIDSLRQQGIIDMPRANQLANRSLLAPSDARLNGELRAIERQRAAQPVAPSAAALRAAEMQRRDALVRGPLMQIATAQNNVSEMRNKTFDGSADYLRKGVTGGSAYEQVNQHLDDAKAQLVDAYRAEPFDQARFDGAVQNVQRVINGEVAPLMGRDRIGDGLLTTAEGVKHGAGAVVDMGGAAAGPAGAAVVGVKDAAYSLAEGNDVATSLFVGACGAAGTLASRIGGSASKIVISGAAKTFAAAAKEFATERAELMRKGEWNEDTKAELSQKIFDKSLKQMPMEVAEAAFDTGLHGGSVVDGEAKEKLAEILGKAASMAWEHLVAD